MLVDDSELMEMETVNNRKEETECTDVNEGDANWVSDIRSLENMLYP